MALQTKKGTFSANTTTGNQTITGVGFTPKALILWTDHQTATGTTSTTAKVNFSVGYTDGVAQASGGNITDDNTLNRGRAWSESACLITLNAASPINQDSSASIVSFNADGFTINWGTAPASAILIHYYVLGGSDITNVKVGLFNTDNNGNISFPQAITGVGFQPDLLMFLCTSQLSAGTNTSDSHFTISAANDASGTGLIYTSGGTLYARAGGSILATEGLKTATLTSMDSNGFTINWAASPFNLFRVAYLAIKGGKYKVGSDTQATSVTTKATSGFGFQPVGVMLLNPQRTASTSATDEERVGLGTASAVGTEGTIWKHSPDTNPARAASATLTNKIIRTADTQADGSVVQRAEASLASLDSDGFSLSWTTADATAREFFYIGIGSIISPQKLRPTSDISVGTWVPIPSSPTTLYDKLDEVVADDADYIQSSLSPVSADICEVKFGAGQDPASSIGHILRYRYKKDATGGDRIDLTVRLMQGATEIANWVHTNIDAVTQGQQTLTGTQADSITDYTNLRVRMEAIKI